MCLFAVDVLLSDENSFTVENSPDVNRGANRKLWECAQKGTFNVLIIRPRHKINIVDDSISFFLLNLSVCFLWYECMKKTIATKCQACQTRRIQIRQQNESETASQWISSNSSAHATLEVKHTKHRSTLWKRSDSPVSLHRHASQYKQNTFGFNRTNQREKKAICRCHLWIMKILMRLSAAVWSPTSLYHSHTAALWPAGVCVWLSLTLKRFNYGNYWQLTRANCLTTILIKWFSLVWRCFYKGKSVWKYLASTVR